MKKKIFGSIAIIAIITVTALNVNFNTQNNDLSTISLTNVEALAQSESGSHYWCCGNTDTCASGPNYRINGKLKSSPC